MSPLHVELQLDYLLLHSFTRILLTVGFIAGDLFQKIYISVKYWRYIGGVLFTFYTFTVSHIPVYLWYKSKYRLPFFRVKIRLWKLNVLKIRDKSMNILNWIRLWYIGNLHVVCYSHFSFLTFLDTLTNQIQSVKSNYHDKPNDLNNGALCKIWVGIQNFRLELKKIRNKNVKCY